MSKEPHSVEETVEAIEDLADKADSKVCIGDVLDEFGKRSFGPVLMIFALIEITPVGGIPGVPTFLAAMCALVAVQLLFARDHIYVPQFIQDRSVAARKLHDSAEKLEGFAEKLDGWFHGRLKQFTGPTWQKIAAALILLLCFTVPPLEFLPFASSAPMLAIAAFGLALTVRDGLLMLVASGLAVTALGVGTYLYQTSESAGGGGMM